MTAAAGLEVESLVVDHQTPAGVVRALDGVSFKVSVGSSLAVVGPSGCGKSTLLGLLGGLDVPTSGAVRVRQAEISAFTDRERSRFRRLHMGIVYQADNLLPFLTVLENVSLQLALHGDWDAESGQATDRAMALLGQLGLDSAAGRLPDQLSGGQRQRVAVARAIVHRPAVILADEPTGALDPPNASMVVDLLLQAKEALGATMVMVTHDAESAMRLDRLITLRDGAVVGDSGRHRVG